MNRDGMLNGALRDIVNCYVQVPAFAGMTGLACFVMGNSAVKHEILRLRSG